MRWRVTVGAETIPVEVTEVGDVPGHYRVRIGDGWVEVDARMANRGPASLLIDGASWVADEIVEDDGEIVVTLGGVTHRLRVEEPGRRVGPRGAARGGGAGQRLTAPMPGRVVAVHVAVGDSVEPGTPLAVLEAMKMENEFRATVGGVVTEVAIAAGQVVNAGDLLVVVGPREA